MSYRNCELEAYLREIDALYVMRIVDVDPATGKKTFKPLNWAGVLEEVSGVDENGEGIMRHVVCVSSTDLGEDEVGLGLKDNSDLDETVYSEEE